jgi:sulfur carrier protein ThiS
MKITVEYLNVKSRIILPEGATIADAISACGIASEDIGFAVMQDKVTLRDFALTNGDEIKLVPAIVGG